MERSFAKVLSQTKLLGTSLEVQSQCMCRSSLRRRSSRSHLIAVYCVHPEDHQPYPSVRLRCCHRAHSGQSHAAAVHHCQNGCCRPRKTAPDRLALMKSALDQTARSSRGLRLPRSFAQVRQVQTGADCSACRRSCCSSPCSLPCSVTQSVPQYASCRVQQTHSKPALSLLRTTRSLIVPVVLPVPIMPRLAIRIHTRCRCRARRRDLRRSLRRCIPGRLARAYLNEVVFARSGNFSQ